MLTIVKPIMLKNTIKNNLMHSRTIACNEVRKRI